MHSEDKDKTYNKGMNQRTASQFDAQFSPAKVSIFSLVERLENNTIQCAASTQSQNCLPTSWASDLERENSGFSV
jgi:hypothetical protein